MTEPLTPEDLAAIRERAEKATAGPWQRSFPRRSLVIAKDEEQGEWLGVAQIQLGDERQMMADAAFIAHARTDIPRLVAEVERLQKPDGLVAENLLFLQPARDVEELGLHLTAVAAKRIRELEAALAAEREACARIADGWSDTKAGQQIAADIRSQAAREEVDRG